MAWIVMDIGCIECGESSDLVGVYPTKDQAEAVIEKLEQAGLRWRGGQHEFEAFDTEAPQSEEYAKALTGERR